MGSCWTATPSPTFNKLAAEETKWGDDVEAGRGGEPSPERSYSESEPPGNPAAAMPPRPSDKIAPRPPEETPGTPPPAHEDLVEMISQLRQRLDEQQQTLEEQQQVLSSLSPASAAKQDADGPHPAASCRCCGHDVGPAQAEKAYQWSFFKLLSTTVLMGGAIGVGELNERCLTSRGSQINRGVACSLRRFRFLTRSRPLFRSNHEDGEDRGGHQHTAG